MKLKIMEAYTRDVGRGVARIDYDSMETLPASTGDVLEIKGKRRTVAKCLPLYPSDEGKGIVRVDGLIRNNSGITTGQLVTIKKIKALAATYVAVRPVEAIPPIDERYLADALESVPLIIGDYIMVPYFGGRLTFRVLKISPTADAVMVTQKTVFEIGPLIKSKNAEQIEQTLNIIDKRIAEYEKKLIKVINSEKLDEAQISKIRSMLNELNGLKKYFEKKV